MTHTPNPAQGVPAPAKPDPSRFVSAGSSRVLIGYFRQVSEKYSYATNFGMALDDADQSVDSADRRPVLLSRLFVPPFLGPRHLDPAEMARREADSEQRDDAFEEAHRALRDRRWLFVVGDPGSGKSTLLSWLMLGLSSSGAHPVKEALGPLVPFNLVLRDLDLRGVEDWPGLWSVFEAANTDLLAAFSSSDSEREPSPHHLLDSGQALVMLDGLDEVSAPKQRAALGRALRDGLRRYPRSRFLITSRRVGFSQAEFLDLERSSPAVHRLGLVQLGLEHESASGEPLGPDLDLTDLRDRKDPLPVQYLIPFSAAQVTQFARNWYALYDPDRSSHAARVRDLQQRVAEHGGLGELTRVPVLLNLICFIQARRGRLPEGRGELFQRIAETYLTGLERARGLQFRGRELGYDLQDLSEWLGRLAWMLQERRSGKEAPNDHPEGLLISEQELRDVFGKGLSERGLPDDQVADETQFLIAYIAERSGFLVPRGRQGGEEHYGFNHLSFQEYFAAHQLLARAPYLDDDEWKALEPYRSDPAWHETLLLLFELASTRDAEHCAARLFGECGEYLPTIEQEADLRAWGLAAEVAMDSAVRLGHEARSKLIDAAWKAFLVRPMGNEDPGDTKNLRPSDWDWHSLCNPLWTSKFNSLDRLRRFGTRLTELSLVGDRVHDLKPLASLSRLESLRLIGAISDLTPLATLNRLKQLTIGSTSITSLAPIATLTKLEYLQLTLPQVNDLRHIENLPALRILIIGECPIAVVGPLAGISSLKSLYLNGTSVADPLALSRLTQLKLLSLDDTNIDDLEPLQDLSKLEVLTLNRTSVADLTPLTELSKLLILNLDDTPVTDLSPLAGLSNLAHVNIKGTGVTDLGPVTRPGLEVIGP